MTEAEQIHPVTEPRSRAARPRLPGWLLALLVYLAARVLTTALTLIAAHGQPANLWTPAAPGYGDFVTMWDGDRYRLIAERGYPLPFPVDASGRPTQSEWAFFPAYPALARGLMLATGLPFTVIGPALSFLLGAAAAVYAYRLFRRHAGRGAALAGVGLVMCFPTAAVLQYGYSESLCLLALLGSLCHLDERRYGPAMAFVLLLGLSRPIGLAILPVIGLHWIVRWWRHRRGAEMFSPGERRMAGALLGVAVLSALAFPALVALVSGHLDGYTQVQQAWRVGQRMQYFTPWVWMSRYVFGSAGPALLGLLVALVAAVLAAPSVRALGLTMWSWCLAYALYLAAVLDPFTSLPRFLLLFAPLGLAAATAARPGWRRILLTGGLLAGFLLAQGWWIFVLWRFTPPSDFPP